MHPPVRACICFFGMNRSLSGTIGSIRRNIYAPLERRGIPFEVFGAFMEPGAPFTNVLSGETGCVTEDSYHLLGKASVTRIDQRRFDETFDFSAALAGPDIYRDGHASSRNICRALHALDTVTGMWQASGQGGAFDLFLYLRPDIVYHDPLPLGSILKAHARFGPDLMMVPYWESWKGLNDRFACLGRNSALRYGGRIREVGAFVAQSPVGLHPESFVAYVARSVPGFEEQPSLMMRGSRLRANGRLMPERFIAERHRRRQTAFTPKLWLIHNAQRVMGRFGLLPSRDPRKAKPGS
jgi:hypothetical protein